MSGVPAAALRSGRMTEFEEAVMIRAAAQGDERARRWLAELHARTNGRDGIPSSWWRAGERA